MAKESGNAFTGQSSSLIGLIGILGVSLMTMGGPFVTMWARLYPPQLVVAAGGIVFGVAYVLASLSHELWEFAITQGILAGVGTSMAYVTTTSVAPTWFEQHRGLAMGLIVAGTGVGGMIWPPVLRAIIDSLGFRDAMRISGCITLGLVCLAAAPMRWEPKFREQIRTQMQSEEQSSLKLSKYLRGFQLPKINWEIVKTNKFIAQAMGNFIQSAAYSVPLFYYAAYAQSLGYAPSMADDFITISNASNFVSRVVIGYCADKFGRINALFITTVLSSIAVFAFWIPTTYLACSNENNDPCDNSKYDVLNIFFVIFYGAFASAYISLFPASLLELFGRKHFSSVNGQLSLIRGMGALLGTPLISLLIPQAQSLTSPWVYQRAVIVVAVLLFAASVATLWVRIEATRGSSWKWNA
jgi:MFS family permease